MLLLLDGTRALKAVCTLEERTERPGEAVDVDGEEWEEFNGAYWDGIGL